MDAPIGLQAGGTASFGPDVLASFAFDESGGGGDSFTIVEAWNSHAIVTLKQKKGCLMSLENG